MKMILLSGGSGKRLWPLSNDYRSKQFIKVMDHDDHSTESHPSMIQRVWEQLTQLGLAQLAVIAASIRQEEVIRSQLGQAVPLVLEPIQRDTFPAICLAASYLHTKMNIKDDEIIVVMPVDVDADDGFYRSIQQLAIEFEQSTANIGLIGLKPTSPSEKFGYILTKPSHTGSIIETVHRFIEKPCATEASKLIANGALWNCGVFAFRLGYILRMLESENWPTQYEKLLGQYHLMPAISFDYQVVEKEEHVIVNPYSGRWNDLGTWNEWTDQMPSQLNGKGIISEDSFHTHVINELQIPVVVLGISNAVVAASPDGILVSNKDQSPRLKELVQSTSSRPMYEETLYGWYRVIDIENRAQDEQVITKRVHIWAGKSISYQVHHHRDEIWTLIKGKADIVINGHRFQADTGDVIHIEKGSKHAIRAVDEIDLIEVQIGNPVNEEDVIRYEYNWYTQELLRKEGVTG